jgi:hypothetical protein
MILGLSIFFLSTLISIHALSKTHTHTHTHTQFFRKNATGTKNGLEGGEIEGSKVKYINYLQTG